MRRRCTPPAGVQDALCPRQGALRGGEKVAAIAATTKELAEEAADLIEVEYEPLQGSGHVLDSIKEAMPVINEGTELLDAPADNPWGVTKLNNVAGEHHSVEGDVEAGFAESDRVYTHTFYIPRAHQTYIEPQGNGGRRGHGAEK